MKQQIGIMVGFERDIAHAGDEPICDYGKRMQEMLAAGLSKMNKELAEERDNRNDWSGASVRCDSGA